MAVAEGDGEPPPVGGSLPRVPQTNATLPPLVLPSEVPAAPSANQNTFQRSRVTFDANADGPAGVEAARLAMVDDGAAEGTNGLAAAAHAEPSPAGGRAVPLTLSLMYRYVLAWCEGGVSRF